MPLSDETLRARRVQVFREVSEAAIAHDRQLVADLKASLADAERELATLRAELDAARQATDSAIAAAKALHAIGPWR